MTFNGGGGAGGNNIYPSFFQPGPVIDYPMLPFQSFSPYLEQCPEQIPFDDPYYYYPVDTDKKQLTKPVHKEDDGTLGKLFGGIIDIISPKKKDTNPDKANPDKDKIDNAMKVIGKNKIKEETHTTTTGEEKEETPIKEENLVNYTKLTEFNNKYKDYVAISECVVGIMSLCNLILKLNSKSVNLDPELINIGIGIVNSVLNIINKDNIDIKIDDFSNIENIKDKLDYIIKGILHYELNPDKFITFLNDGLFEEICKLYNVKGELYIMTKKTLVGFIKPLGGPQSLFGKRRTKRSKKKAQRPQRSKKKSRKARRSRKVRKELIKVHKIA